MLSDDFGTLDAEYKCELRGQQHGALSPQRAAVSLVLMFYHLLCANILSLRPCPKLCTSLMRPQNKTTLITSEIKAPVIAAASTVYVVSWNHFSATCD